MISGPSIIYRFADLQREALTRVFLAYSEATGVKLSYLSGEFAGDTSFFGRLSKHRPNTRKTDTILQKFSDAWPDNASWPDEVPRPPVGKWDDLAKGATA